MKLLRAYPAPASHAALAKALEDDHALIRYTAIRSLEYVDAETRLKCIAPKLYDPVKAIRIEAARMHSSLPEEKLRQRDRAAFHGGLDGYRQALLYNADLPGQRYDLGNLAANLGNDKAAIEAYKKAIAIDDQFYPAMVNLAMLSNRQGNNGEAESLSGEMLDQDPTLYEVVYALGLLLAEMQCSPAAELYLGRAASGMPNSSRAQQNLAMVLLVLKKPEQTETALKRTLALEPEFLLSSGELFSQCEAGGKSQDASS